MRARFSSPQLFQRCKSTISKEWKAPKEVPSFVRSVSASNINSSPSLEVEQEVSNRRVEFKVVNWNVAAPNNNPFEYWALHDDERYNELMVAVQHCIDHPDKYDEVIGDIFTTSMFNELKVHLQDFGTTNLEELELLWITDIMHRKCISQFLKDVSFGEKRLISMPDRMTNSIKTEGGQELFRPSPITGSQDDLSDIPTWWSLWKEFIFKKSPCIRGRKLHSVFSMLETIPRAKYPALSEEEEVLSIPLQVLCLALFDAIFTHLLLQIAGDTWQPLKWSLHKALFENKTISSVSILQREYADTDVIFIQEASESFAAKAGVCLDHVVLRTAGVDGRRSQMSLILLRRTTFDASSAREVTDEVLELLKLKCVQKGDLCVFEVASAEGLWLLASFHGDSEGKSTAPVLTAIDCLARDRYPTHTLVVGLDANTTSSPPNFAAAASATTSTPATTTPVTTIIAGPTAAGTAPPAAGLTVQGFAALLAERGLGSCWAGLELDAVWTTFNARTHLQPQLHKAVGLGEVLARRHRQLKDWVVFRADRLAPAAVARDNTGRGAFAQAVMPSMAFPSDHALVATTLRRL